MPTPTLSPTPGPRILYEALFTRARSALTPTRTSAAAAGQRRERGESQLIGVAIVAGEVGWGGGGGGRKGGEEESVLQVYRPNIPSKSENSARKEERSARFKVSLFERAAPVLALERRKT